MSCKVKVRNKVVSCLAIASGGTLAFAGINIMKGNDNFYSKVFMPFVHFVADGETAHNAAIKLAKHGLVPHFNEDIELRPLLKTTVWGLEFANPIGLAAGFDKDGQAVNGLSKLGFGFIEIGSTTPEPQPGNDKPRVFRLLRDKAVINRYGFNSAGHEVVKNNIDRVFRTEPIVRIGLNLGKNKWSEDAAKDYTTGIVKFSDSECVDYLVINISSPNTPNLRQLQNKSELTELIEKVVNVKNEIKLKKPLIVKIAPDLDDQQLLDVANTVKRFASNQSKSGIDGLIVANTTVDRSDLQSEQNLVSETGGLSGLPLRDRSTDLIRKMYKLTDGKVPIIGVGGVFTGEDAYNKIRAGASLVQIYTALTYEGPPIVDRIKRELTQILRTNGFANVVEAVGTDHK